MGNDPDRSPFRKLNRDLALLGVAIVALGGLIGAGIGIAVDVMVHRHRRA